MSLEILQTLPKLAPSSYVLFISSLWGEERNEFGVSLEIFRTLSKFTSNSLQTQMISFFRVFFLYCFFHVCLGKTNGLGVGLEIIQTLPKLAPNSYVFIFSVVIFFSIYIFFWTRGLSLEWVWRFFTLSKLICFFNYFIFSLEKRNEFGVTLEILQTLSKLSPNSLQTHVFFAMSQPKKLLVQEALQSSASSACSAVYELLDFLRPVRHA